MPRTIDATDDKITLALGACGFVFGPGSMAFIGFLGAATPVQQFGGVGDASGSNYYGLSASGADVFRAKIGTTTATAPTIVTTGGQWQMLGASKASGSTAVRFHKYLYSTDTPSHEDDNVSISDSGTPATSVFLGSDGVTTTDAMDGDLAIFAVWNVVLSDAQFEALPFSLAAWFAVQPKGIWLLDQDSTSQKVLDLSGGGANETGLTGTTVGTRSMPVFSYGAPILIRTRDVAAGGAFSINADPGSYALTGSAGAPVAGRQVPASPGSYALTGAVAGVPAGRVVLAAPGSYLLTGSAAQLVAGRMISAAPGAYAITGFAAALEAGVGFSITADPGAYAITGFAAKTVAARTAVAAPGSYSITGISAQVVAGRAVTATTGSYAISGFPAVVAAGRMVVAAPGSYSVSGIAAVLLAAGELVIVTGRFDPPQPIGRSGEPTEADFDPADPSGRVN